MFICPSCNNFSQYDFDNDGLTVSEKIFWKLGGQKRSRSTCLRNGYFFGQKMGSPKSSSYSEEENINDVGARIMYPLHSAGSKFMDLKKPFGIKDDTTKHIPGAEIHNDPDMEYSYLTKAHRRSMT